MELYDSAEHAESLWVQISPSPDAPPVFINATYHPPKVEKSITTTYLHESTSSITDHFPRSTLVIAGDFNKLPLSELEMDLLITLLDTPPTRGPAKLDRYLTNRPDLVDSTSTTSPSLESDHLALILRPTYRTPVKRKKVVFTDFCLAGFRKFNAALEDFDPSELFLMSDANIAAEWLDQQINHIIHKSFPKRQITMSDRDPQWLSPKGQWLLSEKKKALKKNDINRVDDLTQILHKMKMDHNAKCNPSKRFWEEVDFLTNRKANDKSICYSNFDGKKLNIELANRSQSIESANSTTPPTFSSTSKNSTTLQLSIKEVVDVMRQCRKTSSGPSEIPSFVYRDFWDILAPLFLHVWNLSLRTSTFPSSYKHADLIPIPKVRNSKTIEEIRGISITSISARLFEKAVHNKWILPNLKIYGDPFQFAYKPKLSTADCLLMLQHFVLSSLDKQEVDGVHVAMVDFLKAFDSINHDTVTDSFVKFIDSSNLCTWLYSFLKNRKQRLIWQGKPLTYQNIDLGCSQGTVGGPNIFSILTDDIRPHHKTSAIIKYSDDMNLLVPCMLRPKAIDQETFQSEITKLESCASTKGLAINTEKTKLMRFCLNNSPCCQCRFDDNRFQVVSTARILGITFQSNCRFTDHCKNLIRVLKMTLYTIRDLKLNDKSIRDIDSVFQSLILSRIRYCISVYGSDRDTISKLDHFLERCYEKKFCSQKYSATEILATEDQRLLNKIKSNPFHPLSQLLLSCPKERNTRHNITQIKPITRTHAFLNIFVNRVRPF